MVRPNGGLDTASQALSRVPDLCERCINGVTAVAEIVGVVASPARVLESVYAFAVVLLPAVSDKVQLIGKFPADQFASPSVNVYATV